MRRLAPILVACHVATSFAAPQVEIKAQTRLALEKVKLRPDGEVEVSGQLVDKLTSEGIAGQTVTIRIGGESESAITAPDGRFRALFAVIPGPQPVELRFAGAHLLDRADPVALVTDPSRAQVALAVRAEPAPGGITLHIAATVEDTKTSLAVQIASGDSTAAELHPVATVDSGTPFLLTRAAAGGPGSKRVRVTFPGDPTKQQANAETTFELGSTTATSIQVANKSLAYEDNLVINGAVIDEDGKPVARAAVALVSGDRRLAQSATEDDGSYKFKVEAEILGQDLQLPRDFGVQVQAEPISPVFRSSRSDPAVITVAAPQPVPVSYTVAAFIATALAAGGFFTARGKPWRRLRKPGPAADASVDPAAAAPTDGGLVANKPGLVSTLRRPSDDSFSGSVRDTVRGRPVANAAVRIVLGHHVRETATADDGGFVLDKIAVGDWQAEVAAPGHVTERFAIAIPHRGELRGVRVDLVPVRERVFQLYRRAAEPALPEPRLWGIWSPRQIVDHVRGKRPTPALAALTDFVEEVYFSSRLSAETVLADASQRVDRAIQERADRAIHEPAKV